MRMLWRLSAYLPPRFISHRARFRLTATLFWGLLGLCVWLALRLWLTDETQTLICFVGYPAMLLGVMGSAVWLLLHDDTEDNDGSV